MDAFLAVWLDELSAMDALCQALERATTRSQPTSMKPLTHYPGAVAGYLNVGRTSVAACLRLKQ